MVTMFCSAMPALTSLAGWKCSKMCRPVELRRSASSATIWVLVGEVGQGIAHLVAHLFGDVPVGEIELCHDRRLLCLLIRHLVGIVVYRGDDFDGRCQSGRANSSGMPSRLPSCSQTPGATCPAVFRSRGAEVCQLGLYWHSRHLFAFDRVEDEADAACRAVARRSG